jgi:5-formyltetrahydrofolate cyclo-ligase
VERPGVDPAATLQRRKKALRGAAIAARCHLGTDERRVASEAAVERLLDLPELRDVDTVLLYAALEDELDVGAAISALRRRGTRTLLPKVRGGRLELIATGELHSLAVGYRGIREPDGPSIDPEVVDVAVVPGVAFDPVGGRLGRGGGHYDRLLPSLPSDAPRIGMCFACQLVPMVPREPHDAAIDVVVSEHAVYRTNARDDGTPA